MFHINPISSSDYDILGMFWHGKTVGPQTTLAFAGIEFDTVALEACLPADKIIKAQAIILSFLKRKKATLKEIQSLIGLLHFACSVVVPGRAFLCRLIDLTKGIKCTSHFIWLNWSVKADLSMWKSFLDDFNGWLFFLCDNWLTFSSLNLYTDAAAGFGFGAIFSQLWCFGVWPDQWKTFNVVHLRILPNCVECAPLGPFDAESAHRFLY